MPMNDALVFSTFARCFMATDRDEWLALSANTPWSDFLAGVRSLLQDERALGASVAPIRRARRNEPLSDYLAASEVRSIFAPPSFREKRDFASRRFTGGLPSSALPVESLYSTWAKPGAGAFAGREGLYLGDAALYMRDLANAMGIALPAEFSSTPDHLAVELEFIAMMLDAGMHEEARVFCTERLKWLDAYRGRLMEAGEDALFYLALVDALIGIRERQETLSPARTDMRAPASVASA